MRTAPRIGRPGAYDVWCSFTSYRLLALSPPPARILEVDAELILSTFRTPSSCHCGPGYVSLRDTLYQVLSAQRSGHLVPGNLKMMFQIYRQVVRDESLQTGSDFSLLYHRSERRLSYLAYSLSHNDIPGANVSDDSTLPQVSAFVRHLRIYKWDVASPDTHHLRMPSRLSESSS
jgi:hypothetical protein